MGIQNKIVIIGAGFAGLRLAQDLENTNFDVLLIDKNNYHQYQPLMYQVATARLEPASISFPLRKVFQHSKNVRIRIADVLSVDTQSKKLRTSIADFEYDHLIIAFDCKFQGETFGHLLFWKCRNRKICIPYEVSS